MINKTQQSLVDPHTQAQILSQALPFMRRYSGETIVIKYGGHAMGDEKLASFFASDIVLLKQVGINPIVVHGGGPQIEDALKQQKIKSTFVQGLRVTDAETIGVVEEVLSVTINKKILDSIKKAGGTAVGLSGKDKNLIQTTKLTKTIKDSQSKEKREIDLGFVGFPQKINIKALGEYRNSNIIPVIAPIGISKKGETYNVNADTAAGAIAAAVKAKRFLLLTDVAGVISKGGSLIENIDHIEASKLIEKSVIKGGMIPKVETCLRAIQNNVSAAVIIDGRVPHAILLELFTEHGIGTLLSQKSGKK